MWKLGEYDIQIHAPEQFYPCQVLHCKRKGPLHLMIKDDKGNWVVEVKNICHPHTLFIIMEECLLA